MPSRGEAARASAGEQCVGTLFRCATASNRLDPAMLVVATASLNRNRTATLFPIPEGGTPRHGAAPHKDKANARVHLDYAEGCGNTPPGEPK